jgi:hypothetical protein
VGQAAAEAAEISKSLKAALHAQPFWTEENHPSEAKAPLISKTLWHD